MHVGYKGWLLTLLTLHKIPIYRLSIVELLAHKFGIWKCIKTTPQFFKLPNHPSQLEIASPDNNREGCLLEDAMRTVSILSLCYGTLVKEL